MIRRKPTKQRRPSRRKPEYEKQLAHQCVQAGLPKPVLELRFAKDMKPKPRQWRFDLAWPEYMVACEIEGGIWVNGAHTRGKHFESDIEKYNTAQELGWTVYRCIPKHVKNGDAVALIGRVLSYVKQQQNREPLSLLEEALINKIHQQKTKQVNEA